MPAHLTHRQARALGLKPPKRKRQGPNPKEQTEERFALALQAAGLTGYRREVELIPDRLYRWDFVWETPRRVAVEVQGGTAWGLSAHSRGEGYERDAEKRLLAQLAGYLVVDVTTAMIADGRAVEAVRMALGLSEGCAIRSRG